MEYTDDGQKPHWFVLRDLKRPNANLPAYRLLEEANMNVFTPKKWYLATVKGKRVRRQVPVIPDLLFVCDTRENLDPIIERNPLIQYRWLRNMRRTPMTVPDTEMNRFITAVNSTTFPQYYRPDEITPDMIGRMIRIIDGPLNGYEVPLLKMRGSRVKHIIVQIPSLLTATIDVRPDYIQLL
ncbi:MAG: UpxY family transcription antiterminator [Prevotella sp.]|nr:UpxY family transcription antiterminator [Prevotella sp.]